MHIDLDQLSESELIELNTRVVERLRLLRQAKAQVAMFRFNVGDRVSFQSDTGEAICGTLIRHNKKSVTVHTDDGGQWRVSPGLLRSIPDTQVQGSTTTTVVNLPHNP
ncbi:MAG TPA: hypothetical protein VFJ15_08730 [Oleiagrimonas sp.]|nr:hypothetical protein [Oleiagrimonas sp.]